MTRFMDGCYAGVQYYNQQKGKNVEVLGWDGSLADPTKTGTFVGGSGGTDTWNDPAKGEQFAKTFLDQGVDIVHPVAGETGNGTIKAMLAAGKWAIGVDNDQAHHHPRVRRRDPHVCAEGHRRLGPRRDQEDLGRRPRRRGLLRARSPTSGVLLSPFHDFDSQIPAETKTELEALKAAIADGSVKVCTYLGRGC